MKGTRLLVVVMLVFMVGMSVTIQMGCGSGDGVTAPQPDLDGDGIPDSEDPDADGDGSMKEEDCDDLNAAVFPGAPDLPDDAFVDANCDGVDGDVVAAVWVSDAEGDDAFAGDMAHPVKTIAQGIALAGAANPVRPVYVVAGNYTEDVQLTGGVSLFGGYGLLANGLRNRDLTAQRATILGKDGDKPKVVIFGSKDITLQYSVMVDASDSTVDGFVIRGDQTPILTDGVAGGLVVSNASAIIKNCGISDGATSNRVNAAALVTADGAAGKDLAIRFLHNAITLGGSDAIAGSDFGFLGLPTDAATRQMDIEFVGNRIESSGQSHISVGSYASAFSPQTLGFSASGNEVRMVDANADIVIGMAGGIVLGKSLVGNSGAVYVRNFAAEGNRALMSGANAEIFGIAAGLVGPGSRIANNVVRLTDAVFGVNAIVENAEIEVVNNSLSIEVSSPKNNAFFAGLVSLADGHKPQLTNPRFVDNNIMTITLPGSVTNCLAAGIYEVVQNGGGLFASPRWVRNNLFDLEMGCVLGGAYNDATSATSAFIADVGNLNNRIGLLDPADPTSFSANIAGHVAFEGDWLAPQTGAITVDTGIPVDGLATDIDGAARPQGAGFDIGAYER